jgi:hypothetical protein
MDTTNCGRARKHRQHFWTTQQGIVPTPRNDAQSHRQNIAEHRGIPIRAIEAEQDLGGKKLMVRRRGGGYLASTLEFSTQIPIAWSPRSVPSH